MFKHPHSRSPNIFIHPPVWLPFRAAAVKIERDTDGRKHRHFHLSQQMTCHHSPRINCIVTHLIYLASVFFRVTLRFRIKFILLAVFSHISSQDSDILKVASFGAQWYPGFSSELKKFLIS